MENNNTMTAKNPWEDQRKAALELYEEMCAKSHHWSSFIQRAIEAYKEPEPSASHPEPMEVEKGWNWAATYSMDEVLKFLKQYDVQHIVVNHSGRYELFYSKKIATPSPEPAKGKQECNELVQEPLDNNEWGKTGYTSPGK